jgi:hypothetical protein
MGWELTLNFVPRGMSLPRSAGKAPKLAGRLRTSSKKKTLTISPGWSPRRRNRSHASAMCRGNRCGLSTPHSRESFAFVMPKSSVSTPSGWVRENVMRLYCFPERPNLIPPYALRYLCKKGQFPHLKIGKKLFFKVAEVKAYLEKNHVPPEECRVR